MNATDYVQLYQNLVAKGYTGTMEEMMQQILADQDQHSVDQQIGMVTAYAYAVSKGYSGTEDEFAELLANFAAAAQRAEQAAAQAVAAKADAQAAQAAAEAAQTAAQGSATAAAGSATDADTAKTAAEAAQDAAEGSATAAAGSATDADTAKTAAEAAQAAAEAIAASIPEDYTDLSNDVSDLKNDVAELTDQIEDLNYKPVSITAFSVSPNQAEIGSTVSSATLSWTINKKPTTLTLDGNALTPAASGTETKTGMSVTANKTFTLAATDSGSPSHDPASASKTATLSFLSKVHYGLGAASQTITDAFINGLTGVLAASRQRTVSFSPSGSQYIYFALPASMCSGINFVVASGAGAGFALAVDLVANSMSHTNASGGVVAYNVYRSTNPVSSALSVKIE